MSEKKFNRRVLREKCLQALYANEMNKDNLSHIFDMVLADIENDKGKDFVKNLVNKVIQSHEELDNQIKQRVDNWEMNRIALIDKILLRIGIAELMYFPDIPPKVSINEVIEIAKDYSTTKSGKFINGILDAVLSDLRKEGKLNKTGRGLIEETLPKKTTQK